MNYVFFFYGYESLTNSHDHHVELLMRGNLKQLRQVEIQLRDVHTEFRRNRYNIGVCSLIREMTVASRTSEEKVTGR
jgi:hypothetical protein